MRALALGGVLSVLLGACATPGTGRSSLGNTVCPALAIALQMVSPSNGATNVSPAIGELVFRNGPDPFSIVLQGSDGTQARSSTSVNRSDGTSSVSIPELEAHTTYSGAVVEAAPCPVYAGSSGSFTTQ